MRIGLVVNPALMPFIGHLGKAFPWNLSSFKSYLSDFDLLLVQACCLFKTDDYTDWGGIEFIKEIRYLKKYIPIVLTSWNSNLQQELRMRGSTLSRVFLDPLVKFGTVPHVSNLETLIGFADAFNPLEQPYFHESLHSVMDTIYDDHLLIYEKIHFLKNEIESTKANHTEKIKLIQRELLTLTKHVNSFSNSIEIKKLNLDSQIELANLSDENGLLLAFLETYQDRFYRIVNERPETSFFKKNQEQKSILYFDDLETEVNKLTQLVEPFGIQCIGCKSIEDGLKQIQEVPSIVAILSDFRMYDQDGRIEPMQGQFLLKIFQRTFPELYYAILTAYSPSGISDKSSFWENVRYTNNLHIYNKQNVFQQKEPDFHQLIKHILVAESILSNHTEFAITLKDKKKKIYELYHKLEKENDWLANIGHSALQYIEEFRQNNKENRGFGKNAFTFAKNEWSIEAQKALLKKQLLCRRTFIGLWQSVKDKEDKEQLLNQIYDFIFYENPPKLNTSAALTSKQTNLNNYLGLYTQDYYDLRNGLDDLKKRTFPEEYSWLRFNEKKLFHL